MATNLPLDSNINDLHWLEDANSKRLMVMIVLALIFFLVEISFGIRTGSLALITDAFHMLSDVIALGITLYALAASKRRATLRYSFGMVRMEIIGGLINGVFLLSVCLFIVFEAIGRFYRISELSNSENLMIVGGVGVAVNVLGLVLLSGGGHHHGHSHSHGHSHTEHAHAHSHASPEPESSHHGHGHGEGGGGGGSGESLNMKAAYLHVLGDALGSLSVVAVGIFITYTHYSWRFYADPFVSLIIACLIIRSAFPLVTRSVAVLLQSVPKEVSLSGIHEEIERLDGVMNLHELHVWELVNGKAIASAHVILRDKYPYDEAMNNIKQVLHTHGVHVTTLQLEWLQDKHDSDATRSSPTNSLSTQPERESNPTSPIELDEDCKFLCKDECEQAVCCGSQHPLLDEDKLPRRSKSLSSLPIFRRIQSVQPSQTQTAINNNNV